MNDDLSLPQQFTAFPNMYSSGGQQHMNLEQHATELISLGRLQEAEEIFRSLIAAGDDNHNVGSYLAIIYGIQGRTAELIDLLEKSLEDQPNNSDIYYNLGCAFHEYGDLNAAIESYCTALRLQPDDPEAHNNLCLALIEKGELDDAIASCQRAIQLRPNFPAALNNLGSAHLEKGESEIAINLFARAIQIQPDLAEAHNNLGAAFHDLGDIELAMACYQAAIQLNTGYAEAQNNLSMIELLVGNYETGLNRYEARFYCKDNMYSLHANPNCPQWDGSALGKNEPLLLVSEQGLGDTLQFMRYVIALRNQGFSVSISAQNSLHSLIKASGIDQFPLTSEQAMLVEIGCWSPLLSVPRYLHVNPSNPLITDAYIKAPSELIEKWGRMLSAEKRPIIAINWQGNPKKEQKDQRGRSLPLEAFSPISANCNVSLLALQKGFGSEQLETCSFKDAFVCCQDRVSESWDFAETAALIACCDLVITSDTSVAHLAGGMGKTTWLLLNSVPDWRWGLESNTTFWYPSVTLFRQRERGNWDEVIKRVVAELKLAFRI